MFVAVQTGSVPFRQEMAAAAAPGFQGVPSVSMFRTHETARSQVGGRHVSTCVRGTGCWCGRAAELSRADRAAGTGVQLHTHTPHPYVLPGIVGADLGVPLGWVHQALHQTMTLPCR